MDHPDIIKNGLQLEGEETDKFDDFYDKIPDEYIKVMKEKKEKIIRSREMDIAASASASSGKRGIKFYTPTGVRNIQQSAYRAQRRESFLYREQNLGVEESVSAGEDDDQIVTPFAQILAKLKDVRKNLGTVGKKNGFRDQLSFLHHDKKGKDAPVPIAADTLESLDWCLRKLENLQANKPVSKMAEDKFKMLMNHELSVLSKDSKSGLAISRYLTDNYYELQLEHEFSDEDDLNDRQQSFTKKSKPSSKWFISSSPVSKEMSVISAASNFAITSVVDNFARETKLLPDINKWGLDVFSANRSIRDGRVLTCTTFKIFQERKLFETFKIDQKTMLTFLMTVEDHYWSTVTYHNHLHAADVAQSTHILLSSPALAECFKPLEIMAAIIACTIHDVDHPGVTNLYLVNTGSDLALMYNDESVLENHHLAVAFKILQNPACDIFASLSQKQRISVRKMMIDMVLATDMSKHMKLLADLKTMVETKKVAGSGVLLLDEYPDRIQVLQNMVHCSDLSNPTKPLHLYKEWTDRLMNEFWAQGDKEKEEGLEISAMCDRETANVEKSQVGFISFIVQPLWETWGELVYPDINYILDILKSNKSHYEQLLSSD